MQIEYQTIVEAPIAMQAGELKSNIGIFNAIGVKCGTRNKREVFNSKAIPQGFSSTKAKYNAGFTAARNFLHRKNFSAP